MLRRTMLALTIVVLGLVPAVTRAADQSVTDKMKDTATTAKEKAKDAATSAGKELSDSWITLKTKIALLADEKVSSTDVHVTTKAGVITLRGKVATEDARQAAEVDALKIEGAKKVVNYLVVVPKAAQEVVEWIDDQVVKDIEYRLKKDPSLKKASIDVHSDNGIVTLMGDVPSLETSLRASENARQVAGVRAVRNELNVKNEKKQM